MKNKNYYVISNIPIKLPIQSTILYSFLLYYFNVSDIWIGIFIAVYSIVWIASLYGIFKQKKVDLNDESLDGEKAVIKSNFEKRLEKIYNKTK